MRAVVHDRYGPPEVLRVAEVERPVPKDDEVLVRVHASTVTRGDAMGVRSAEYRFTRLITGIRRPRRTIAGMEFAGRVEEVGAAVTEFRVGDEVFGIEGGANAEYVAVRESGAIAQKPTGLTYEEAAAVPDGSLLALTCLRPAYPLREERPRLRRRGLHRNGRGPATRAPLRGRGDGGVRHEGRRARAVAGRAGRPRSLSRGLHEERQDVRRDLRRGRQALVPPLPALAEARRDLHHGRPRVHVPRAARRSHHTVRREQACEARHRPLSQGGPPPHQGARRRGQVPACDRPEVRARRGRRGDPLRRDRPEDGQRRAPRQRGCARRAA